MTAPDHDAEQRMIDHEVRLAHSRLVREQARSVRRQRVEGIVSLHELLWLRRQYASLLRSVETQQEARDLGLSDEVIREARLGNSLDEVWKRLRPSPPPRERR